MTVQRFVLPRGFEEYAPDVIGDDAGHVTHPFVPVPSNELDFWEVFANLLECGEDDVVSNFIVVGQSATRSIACAFTIELVGYFGGQVPKATEFGLKIDRVRYFDLTIGLPVIEVGVIFGRDRAFELFDRIEDVCLKPLETLAQCGFKRGDLEAVGCGFDAPAYLQAIRAKGNPEGLEALVVQDAKDVANVSLASFTEDFFAVSPSTFFAHSSSASRFSSRYA